QRRCAECAAEEEKLQRMPVSITPVLSRFSALNGPLAARFQVPIQSWGNRQMNRQIANQAHQQQPTVTPSARALLQRKCACGNRTMAGGECEECSKKQRLGLQTKLKVNEPGDSYEQEADRSADQAMATPVHHAVSGAPPRTQRFAGQPTGQTDAA